MKRLFIAIACVVAFSAQGASPAKPLAAVVSQATKDPVADFKQLVASASTFTESTSVHQDSKSHKWSKQAYTVGQVKYDVKKTDSLISPAKGIVTFPISVRMTDPFETMEDAELASSYSGRRMTAFVTGEYQLIDGAWRLDQFSYQVSFGDRLDPNTSTMSRDEIAASSNKQGIGVILQKWLR